MNASKIYQLDFFLTEEESEIESLRKRIDSIGDSSTKVRKGTYAKIGDINKRLNDLEERFYHIERNLCLGKK